MVACYWSIKIAPPPDRNPACRGHKAAADNISLTQRLHPLPLGLQITYATGVHTLLHLRADAGTPTPAAVHRGEVGSTRWAALAHYVRRSAAVCEPQLSAERMQEKKKNPKNSKTKAGAAGAWVGRGRGSRRISPRCSASSRLTPAQADLVGKISELTKGPTRRTKGTYAGPAAARAEKPVKDEI